MAKNGDVSDTVFATFIKLRNDHVNMMSRMNTLKKMLKDNNDIIELLKRMTPESRLYRRIGTTVAEESSDEALPHFMARKEHFENEINELTDLMLAREHQLNHFQQQYNLGSLGEEMDDENKYEN